MRRQRNMAQMKEQIKIPEKELNKMEKSNLSDAKFKTLVIRMLKELSEDLKTIKKKEILPFATVWMNLENIMLSEISQSEKDKNHMISLICEI